MPITIKPFRFVHLLFPALLPALWPVQTAQAVCGEANCTATSQVSQGPWSEASTWNVEGDPGCPAFPNNSVDFRWKVIIAPNTTITLDGNFTVTELVINEGPPPPENKGGELIIPLQPVPWQLTVCNDLILGNPSAPTADDGDAGRALRGAASVLGGNTPPILRINWSEESLLVNDAGDAESAQVLGAVDSLVIGGNFSMLTTSEVCVGCVAPFGPVRPNVRVGGDFQNQGQELTIGPKRFRWANGALTLRPELLQGQGQSADGVGQQTFEVGAEDQGALLGPELAKYSIGDLRVNDGTSVQFVDKENNSGMDGWAADSCKEALYVDNLRADAGTTIILDNCRVYYRGPGPVREGVGGVTVKRIGCGELVWIPRAIPAVSTWGLVLTGLLILAAASIVCRRLRRAAA